MEQKTTAEMQSLEREIIESGAVSGAELMERAGQGVADAILAHWPDRDPAPRVVALCGPGNNGGDGFVVARLLTQQGLPVTVYAVGWDGLFEAGGALRPGDAGDNAERWRAMGGESRPLDALELPKDAVVVDALLGIGQTRSSDALLAPFWAAAPSGGDLRCVSIDIPTGYETDTGAPLAARPFPAALVVTFHCEKPVHETLRAQGCKVVVKDIGL